MTKSYNEVILIGNVTADPKNSMMENGNPCSKFTVATNRKYTKANGEQVDTPAFHRCICWGGLTQVIESKVSKSTPVMIQGYLNYRELEVFDREGAPMRVQVAEVVCNEVIILSKNI